MKAKGKIRIIGGQHRGRKVSIVDNVIKPTKDRVRETLFNWLALQTEGNRCLDLFAGTGILGIEALSRGASDVVFVDHRRSILNEIQKQLLCLGLDNFRVVHSDALLFLNDPNYFQPFDLIFLDPPFGVYKIQDFLNHFENHEWLKPEGLIYYESNQKLDCKEYSMRWENYKESKAGNVYYGLLKRKQ
jgi:16S rRNA (guanine966-N2)-methyltransferase